MNTGGPTAIITTIQAPTPSVWTLLARLEVVNGTLLVIGDKKGPVKFDAPNAEFVSFSNQLQLPFRLAQLLPSGHYARKNLGYLIALSRHATSIYETDDDNAPNDAWRVRMMETQAQRITPRPWANVYRLFGDCLIWPRGFPLNRVTDPMTYTHDRSAPLEMLEAPIQQGLANLAPDVDAVWRLVLDREFNFLSQESVWLPPGTWCPFNSQTTWWWPIAYPLMYLPSFCSFRMTDIWRSFIAQRCLWELGYSLVFHGPEVIQQRNVHNLIKDFADECPGYLHNEVLVEELGRLSLKPGIAEVCQNLYCCYEALVSKNLLPQQELPLLRAWMDDIKPLLSQYDLPYTNSRGEDQN